jgi:hypothetical protein
LTERCDECGFDAGSLTTAEIPDVLRRFPRRYRAPLTRFLEGEDGDAVIRARPEPTTWSALEYACHVRDVFAVYVERIERARREDIPTFESMDRDGRATRDRYNEQDPATVADALDANAAALADALDGLAPDEWERTAIHPYPGRAPRSIAWMSRNTVHEGNHHLLDIGRVLRTVRERT